MQKFVAMSFYITVHISFIYFVWIYTYMLLVNEEKSENRFDKDVVVLKIKRVNYITLSLFWTKVGNCLIWPFLLINLSFFA